MREEKSREREEETLIVDCEVLHVCGLEKNTHVAQAAGTQL